MMNEYETRQPNVNTELIRLKIKENETFVRRYVTTYERLKNCHVDML